MTTAPPGPTAIGPGSNRYAIGILAGSQVKGCPSTPNAARVPTMGPPTKIGPPAARAWMRGKQATPRNAQELASVCPRKSEDGIFQISEQNWSLTVLVCKCAGGRREL